MLLVKKLAGQAHTPESMRREAVTEAANGTKEMPVPGAEEG